MVLEEDWDSVGETAKPERRKKFSTITGLLY